jgi:hypothetical protein
MRWSTSVTRGFHRHARTRRSCEEGRERRACGRRQQHHPHRDRREGLGGRTRWRLYARLQHSRRLRPQNCRCVGITGAERIKSAVSLCLWGYAPPNPAGYLDKEFAKLGAGAASISPNGGATFPLQGVGFGFQIGRQVDSRGTALSFRRACTSERMCAARARSTAEESARFGAVPATLHG